MDILLNDDRTQKSTMDDDFFDARSSKYATDFMAENWTSNIDDFVDSMLNVTEDFDKTNHFETLDELKEHIKKDAEAYEQVSKSISDVNIQKITSISSNSSDSGLSSDNLDIDTSPEYEPLSPILPLSNNGISKEKHEICNDVIKALDTKSPLNGVTKVEIRPKRENHILNTIQSKNQIHSIQPRIIKLAAGKQVKVLKLSPQMFNIANDKRLEIQLKNSQTGAKIQTDSGVRFCTKQDLLEGKNIPAQNNVNPRSVLLPLTLQKLKTPKSYQIVNPSNLKKAKLNNLCNVTNYDSQNNKAPTSIQLVSNLTKERSSEDSMSDHTSDAESYMFEEITGDEFKFEECASYDSETSESGAQYPKLILTSEEKRLLTKEGITLPSHYPLTKHEERELKRIRRKIRNKISAQDSRKRKKEYVDGLEERVKQCTEENQTLLKKIKVLQNQNQNLVSQMKRLQSILSKGTNKTAQPTTCLMVLLLSLALIAAPNLKPGQNFKDNELDETVQESVMQNRRNLLFNLKANKDLEDEISVSEFSFLNEDLQNYKANETNEEPLSKKHKMFNDFDVDDENWYQSKAIQKKQNMFTNNIQKNIEYIQNEDLNKNHLINNGNNELFNNHFIDVIPLNTDIFDSITNKIEKSNTFQYKSIIKPIEKTNNSKIMSENLTM